MERMDMERCYACGERIGMLRSVLRPLEVTFESAFDGRVRAAFCSVACHQCSLANAAKIHASGLGAPTDGSGRGGTPPADRRA